MRFEGGFGKSTPYTLHFYGEFDRPAIEAGRWKAEEGAIARIPGAGSSQGGDTRDSLRNSIGTYATFDTRENRVVQLKLGVSFISVDQARLNLEQELAGSFDQAGSAAEAKWAAALGKIQVQGGTSEQRRIFYSALYRTQVMPHDLTGENAWWRSSEPHYEDYYCIWDTFRTLNPLLTLIEPERERAMVRSLLDTYAHTGWLPDARIAGATGPSQGGSNADVVVADAIVKHLGGFDEKLGLDAMLKDGDVDSPDPLNVGRDLGEYLSLGYLSLSKSRSASRTLEFAYDDYAIASAAAALGRPDIAARFAQRSTKWRNLWDPQLKCIHPRYSDGRWLENFDCGREYPDATSDWWDHPFYEGSSRQYSTFVPQDVDGLIERLGGKAGFVAWLDRFFDEGAYTHGNEPDILAPWLYIHAGRPDRTAERVRAIMGWDIEDPQRLGPELLGRSGDSRVAVLAGCDHGCRGAVAEQSGGDDGGGIVAVEADRDRAGLDGDEQPACSRLGSGQPRREREPIDAPGAAEAEDGNAADVVAEADPLRDPRLQARSRDARGRNGDDAVDIARPETGFFDCCSCSFDEQFLRRFKINGVAVMPAVPRHVPFGRSDDMPPSDPGIVEHAGEAVEQRLLAAERFAGTRLGLGLFHDVGGNRRRQ
jgi:hypothetical protein